MPEPGNHHVRGDRLKSGDTLGSLLERQGIDPAERHAIGQVLTTKMSPKKLKVGAFVTLLIDRDDQKLVELRITNSPDEAVRVIRDQQGKWVVQELDLHLFTSLQRGSGSIKGSFWNSARRVDVPPEIILDLADMFGWQVDFASGLQPNDSFDMFYTNRTYKELGVKPGIISAARFSCSGEDFYGFAYNLPDGTTEYFDKDGNSMKRAFLKSPLQYRAITSGFSRSRFHPVLKIYRPHLGIDYAAPAGTPVSALGDGVVQYCGWRGGYGNYVQIKHGDSYETCYGHLKRFGKNIRKGTQVRQGQIIGYVGSTGLSTGPHLDFRVRYRGTFINPLNVKSEPAAPVPADLRDDYFNHYRQWMERFQLPKEGESYVVGEFSEV